MTARYAYDAKGRRKYLNRNEGQKFVAETCKVSRDRALFGLTLYYTGCRISEALSLHRSDIDCETHVVLVKTLKKRGKHEIRRIPVPEFLTHELKGLNAESDGPLWSFSRTTAWRVVKEIMRDAEISGIHATAKGLRHGFGVRGALEKIPVSLIQHWMGHADSSTTAIYLAVKDDEERELMKKTW